MDIWPGFSEGRLLRIFLDELFAGGFGQARNIGGQALAVGQ